MGLFNRISQLIKSNVNEMVEAAEDPRAMLDQAVTQLEAEKKATEKKRLEVATLLKVAEKQLAGHRTRASECETKAMTALKAGQEDLARFALTEKQKADELATEMEAQVAAQKQMVQDMTDGLKLMEERLAEAKVKRQELRTRLAKAEAEHKKQQQAAAPGMARKDSIGDTSAFEGFDRMVEKIENTEAEVEAHQELAAASGNPIRTAAEQKLLTGTTSAGVDDALAALKAKLGK